MLNTLFQPDDSIEVRCLHKDQVMKQGKYEPAPNIFWGTVEQIRALDPKLVKLNEAGYNIYFGANPRMGHSKTAVNLCRSLFVDIDHMDYEEARTWLTVAMTEWQIPEPSICVSSGNGVHFYWRTAEPMSVADWHKAQKALIATFNLTSKIADPVIHDSPRIMRLPGFINHKGGATATMLFGGGPVAKYSDFDCCFDNLKPVVAPKPVSDYKGDNANALARALKYHELRAGAGEGSRNAEAYKIAACCLNDFGLSGPDAEHVLSVWNTKNNPPLDLVELTGVVGKAAHSTAGKQTCSKDRPMPEHQQAAIAATAGPSPAPAPTRSAQGVDFAVVEKMVENFVLIAGTTDVWDLENGYTMPLAALSALYPMEIKCWKTDSNRKAILSKDLVFEPSGVVASGQINIFRGFQFQTDSRPMPLLTSHIEMLCDNNDAYVAWVTSWMALQCQQPGKKIASSIIMHGKQGTGKSMLWECFGKIFDPYFLVIDQNILESEFNSWASRKTFVLAEEVLANQSKSKLKNVIKQMVTGGTMQINQKFTQVRQERCYMNVAFLSNNRLPMLLDEEDRRFMVLLCDQVQSKEYYEALAAEIADNGPARLYNYLMKWNLDGFDCHTKPLHTKAKAAMIDRVLDPAKIFMNEWLAGDIEGLPLLPCKKNDLFSAFTVYCKISGLHGCSRHWFYSTIEEDYPQIKEKHWSAYRLYHLEGLEDVEVFQFSDSLDRYIARAQDRKV